MKFLDSIGVSTLWEAIKDLVNSNREYKVGDIVLIDGSVIPASDLGGDTSSAIGVVIESGTGKFVRWPSYSGALISSDPTYMSDAINIFTDGYSTRDSLESGLDTINRCELEVYKLTGSRSIDHFNNYFPVMYYSKYNSSVITKALAHVASILEVQYIRENTNITSSLTLIGPRLPRSIHSCSWDRNSDKNVFCNNLLNSSYNATSGLGRYLLIDYVKV